MSSVRMYVRKGSYGLRTALVVAWYIEDLLALDASSHVVESYEGQGEKLGERRWAVMPD